HLDMARLLEIFLDIDGVVAERSAGLRTRRGEGERQVVLRARHFHAAPAAAGRRLDDDRVADTRGDALRLALVGNRAFRAGNDRDAEALGGALGLDLVAHDADMVARGADEGDVVRGED